LRKRQIGLPNVSRQPAYLTDLPREGVAKDAVARRPDQRPVSAWFITASNGPTDVRHATVRFVAFAARPHGCRGPAVRRFEVEQCSGPTFRRDAAIRSDASGNCRGNRWDRRAGRQIRVKNLFIKWQRSFSCNLLP